MNRSKSTDFVVQKTGPRKGSEKRSPYNKNLKINKYFNLSKRLKKKLDIPQAQGPGDLHQIPRKLCEHL